MLSFLPPLLKFFNQNHILLLLKKKKCLETNLFVSHFTYFIFTLQIIVTLNHPYFHWSTIWSELCFIQISTLSLSSSSCLLHIYIICVCTHVKYDDESIKMFNVTYSWEFGFYSAKGYIWAITFIHYEAWRCIVDEIIIIRRRDDYDFLLIFFFLGWSGWQKWMNDLFSVFD